MQLYLSETPVALDPSASLSLNFVCPAFDVESTERGYSLPFRLPQTPQLLEFAKHKNRLDTADSGDSIPARVDSQNSTLARGVYKIEKSSGGLFDGHFENESRVNVSSLSQLKIDNLLSVIEIPQTVLPRLLLQIRPKNLATGYEVTINDHEYRPDGQTQNDIGQSLANGINQKFNEVIAVWDAASFIVRVKNPASGGLKAVKQTPYFNGVEILNTSRSIPGAQQENFLDFVRTSLVSPRADVSFALMANEKLYAGKNAAWSTIINFAEYDRASQFWRLGKSDPSVVETDWTYTYIPFFRVSYILARIADKLGVSVIESDIAEWAELMQLVVYNNYSLDDVKQAYEFAELKWTNGHAIKIDPKNHVPSLSVTEFLYQFCEVGNLTWKVKDEKLVFSYKDDLLRGDVAEDWTEYLITNTDERGYKTNKGLKFAFSTDSSDSVTSALIEPYIEGEGGELIQLKAGTLPEKVVLGVKEACFSSQVRQDSVSTLRFMFDRGRQIENADTEYLPTASAARFGNVALSPAFLYNLCWRESAQYRASGWSFEAQFQMPTSALTKALLWKTALRRIGTKNGSRIAAIWKIQITERVTGSTDVKIEFKVK